MSNVRFSTTYPDDLSDPIVDIDGDTLKLSDWTSADGRRLDIDISVDGKRARTVRFDEGLVRVLRDRLSAWLDAPATEATSP